MSTSHNFTLVTRQRKVKSGLASVWQWIISPYEAKPFLSHLGVDVPDALVDYFPKSWHESPITHKSPTFDELWAKYMTSSSLLTDPCLFMGLTTDDIRRVPGLPAYENLTWIGFDLKKSTQARTLHRSSNMIIPGPEVYSALHHFDLWPMKTLSRDDQFYWHTGFQVLRGDEWHDVLGETSRQGTTLTLSDNPFISIKSSRVLGPVAGAS